MKGYLLDTNVLSETMRGDRAHPQVKLWFESLQSSEIYFSILTLGELVYGIAKLAKKDKLAAARLDKWLVKIRSSYANKFLPVCEEVSSLWGTLRSSSKHTPPPIDSLIAATACFYELKLATRNESDFKAFPIEVFNPWKF